MAIVKTANDIDALYVEGLEQSFSAGGEPALGAYEIGRLALAHDVGLLDLATIHHSALLRTLRNSRDPGEMETRVRVASQFFAESLSSYEMAHRGYRDAVAGLRHLNEILELEVKRIAHTVHDEAGQILVLVHLALAEISKELPPAQQARIHDVSGLLNQVENQLRGLSHELRPTILDDLGLIPALQFLADRVSRRCSLAIQVNGESEKRLLPAVETVLYRIVQEALNNVTKHSRAKNVWIQLGGDTRKTVCYVRDDGVGFDAPACLSEKGKKGLGLLGIQERLAAIGGTLQITSEPGRGTLLMVTVPKENSSASAGRACR